MTPQRYNRLMQVLHHRQPDLTVIMENIHDPHNIAAVMRTCDSVGIQDIYVLNKKEEMMDENTVGFRSSSSANKWLTVHHFYEPEDCIQHVRKQYSRILATYLNADAVNLYEVDFTHEPTAIVFGNEHSGISKELLPLCDGNMVIPQVGMIQSLNISVACAVTVYEAFRQKQAAGHYASPRLASPHLLALKKAWGMEG